MYNLEEQEELNELSSTLENTQSIIKTYQEDTLV